MKLKSILFSILAGAFVLVSCQEKEQEQAAGLSLDTTEDVVISSKGGSATVKVTSSREWKVVTEADWLQFSVDGNDIAGTKIAPSSKAVTVEISALPNEGHDRSADVIFNGGTTARQTIVVKQAGDLGELEVIGEGAGTLESPYSASQAHDIAAQLASGAKSDKAVYVRGIIHKLASKHTDDQIATYGNGSFYISDDGNASDSDFYCYQVNYLGNSKFTSADQVKVGDDIVVYGKLTNYNGTCETVGQGASYLVSLNGKGAESKEYTIDEAIAAASGIATVTGRIIALSKNGFVINDGTVNNMFVPKPESGRSVGDIVKVTGPLSTYGKCIRLGDASAHADIVVESSTATVAATPSQTLTELQPTDLASYDCGGSATYISLAGTLTTSESNGVQYYNLEFDNNTKPGGSVYTSQDISALVGKRVKVTGYFAGKTNNWFMICTTEVVEDSTNYLSATPATLTATNAGGELEIAVSGNVAWTASVDSAFVTLSPASGTGAGTVKVTVAENKTYTSRIATIKIATEAEVATKSYEVKLTQTGAPDPNAKYVELTNAEITESLKTATASAYGDWTFSSASGEWKASIYVKALSYIQIRNKPTSYVETIASEKEISKIEVNACAIVSGSNTYTRTLYAVPCDTDLSKIGDEKKGTYASSVIEKAYGSAKFEGGANVATTQTIDMSAAGVKQCRLVSYDGALYINWIKVYYK